MTRVRVLQVYLRALGLFILFYWVGGHWLYPDWYHNLMGFQEYDLAMAQVIGTLTVLPMLGAFFSAVNPLRNRDFIVALMVQSVLMALTYVYLVGRGDFPSREYWNVAILLLNVVVLGCLYPWRNEEWKDVA